MNTSDEINSAAVELARRIADTEDIPSVRHPTAPEVLGRALAAAIADQHPDVVVVWESGLTEVVGHVIARELRATLTVAWEDLGSLDLTDPIHPGQRAALVSVSWPQEARGADSLMGLVGNRGAEVVAVASVLGPAPAGAPAGVTSCALEDLHPRATGAEGVAADQTTDRTQP